MDDDCYSEPYSDDLYEHELLQLDEDRRSGEFDHESDYEIDPCDCGECGECCSRYDPDGAYASDGTYLGSTHPRCEDAPCCGCCD